MRQIKGVHFDFYGQGRERNNGTTVPDSGHRLRLMITSFEGDPHWEKLQLG